MKNNYSWNDVFESCIMRKMTEGLWWILLKTDHKNLCYHRAKKLPTKWRLHIKAIVYRAVLNLQLNEKDIGILTSSLIAGFTVLYAAMWQTFFVYTHIAVFTFIALVEQPSANLTKYHSLFLQICTVNPSCKVEEPWKLYTTLRMDVTS